MFQPKQFTQTLTATGTKNRRLGFDPIWKEIEARYYPEIEARLIELARQAGLGFYPVLEKNDGKPAFYRLAAKEIGAYDDASVLCDEVVSAA